MRKKAWTDEDVKLNENSRSMTKRVLQKVMKDNNYEVPSGVFDKPKSSSEAEGVVGDFMESARRAIGGEGDLAPGTESKGNGIFQNSEKTETAITGKSDHGENQIQITPKERPPLPAEKKESYKRLFKKGFSMPANMMVQLGFVEGELQPEEKPKSFTEQVDEFAEDLAVYCFENNIPLPPMIELIAILASGAMIFGVPIITKVMGMKKDKKKRYTKRRTTHFVKCTKR